MTSSPAGNRIDVVIPIYNAPDDVRRCVASVLACTTGDFRLILIDDASPDPGVREALRDIEQRGRTFAAVREQYYRTVRPMHLQFVEPSKRWADVIIPEGGSNQVAVEMIIARLKNVLETTTAA